jgi:hypothetical protein
LDARGKLNFIPDKKKLMGRLSLINYWFFERRVHLRGRNLLFT